LPSAGCLRENRQKHFASAVFCVAIAPAAASGNTAATHPPLSNGISAIIRRGSSGRWRSLCFDLLVVRRATIIHWTRQTPGKWMCRVSEPCRHISSTSTTQEPAGCRRLIEVAGGRIRRSAFIRFPCFYDGWIGEMPSSRDVVLHLAIGIVETFRFLAFNTYYCQLGLGVETRGMPAPYTRIRSAKEVPWGQNSTLARRKLPFNSYSRRHRS
jgi:hypothetical protein